MRMLGPSHQRLALPLLDRLADLSKLLRIVLDQGHCGARQGFWHRGVVL